MAFTTLVTIGVLISILVIFIALKLISKPRDIRYEWRTVQGSTSLVVLVHGLSGRKKFESTIRLARETLTKSDLLIFDYKSIGLSNESPYKIANFIEHKIHDAYTKHLYKEIILVGYSMGGMIMRKALLWGNGIEEDRGLGIFGKREWVAKVSRFVSLAAINRGWSTSPRPENMSFGKKIFYSLLERIARITDTGKLIRSFKRGSPFIADARVQWISFCRDSNARYNVPQTIHLLGDTDDIVSKEDSMDLGVAKDTIFVSLLQTGHREIGSALNGGNSIADKQRREKVALALMGQINLLQPSLAMQLIEDPSVQKIVYIMHGIRDYGEWTDLLRSLINKKVTGNNRKIQVINQKYGHFPMMPFLLFNDRQKNVRAFMDEYTENRARYPNAVMFDFVGHSNGTYILASALQQYRTLMVDKVFFAGSVVPKHYRWRDLADNNRVRQVVNVVAAGDWVVAIFPRFFEQIAEWLHLKPVYGLLDIGSAGFRGFEDSSVASRIENIQFAKGSHGTAVDAKNANKLDAIAEYIVLDNKSPFSIFRNKNAPNGRLSVISNISWLVWFLLVAGLIALGIFLFGCNLWIGLMYVLVLLLLLNSV